MGKERPLSPQSVEVLEVLKERGPATMQELNDGSIKGLNSAHFTALVNRGFATAEKIVVEVPTVVKRKVNAYTITEEGLNFKEEE